MDSRRNGVDRRRPTRLRPPVCRPGGPAPGTLMSMPESCSSEASGESITHPGAHPELLFSTPFRRPESNEGSAHLGTHILIMCISGHRSGISAVQPLRTVGGGRAGAGDRQHSCFPRLDGPERASAGPLRGFTVGRDLRRRATGLCRVVPVALAATGLINQHDSHEPSSRKRRETYDDHLRNHRQHTPKPVL
jgi:hypothetical protein